MVVTYYTIQKIMTGLLDAQHYLGNTRALDVAVKMAGYFEKRLASLKPEELEKIFRTDRNRNPPNEFGAMKQTPVVAEIQATQEYLGQAKHLVYLGMMWEEFLDSDTYARGSGSTVGKALAGKVHPSRVTGMVSVTNPGLDTNWCGHHFSQANWFAFGRLAWNPELSAEKVADEWTILEYFQRFSKSQITRST